jgi:hypothetical protein
MATQTDRIKGIKRYQHPVTGIWYAYHRKTGRRVDSEWRSPEFFHEVEALNLAVKEPEPAPPPAPLPMRTSGKPIYKRSSREVQLEKHMSVIVRSIRTRSTQRGFGCDITTDDMMLMFAKQEGRCALSGLKFDLRAGVQARLRPWAPSVDRIDIKKGYLKGNVRLVCIAANMARGDWDDEVFMALIKGIYETAETREYLARHEGAEF